MSAPLASVPDLLSIRVLLCVSLRLRLVGQLLVIRHRGGQCGWEATLSGDARGVDESDARTLAAPQSSAAIAFHLRRRSLLSSPRPSHTCRHESAMGGRSRCIPSALVTLRRRTLAQQRGRTQRRERGPADSTTHTTGTARHATQRQRMHARPSRLLYVANGKRRRIGSPSLPQPQQGDHLRIIAPLCVAVWECQPPLDRSPSFASEASEGRPWHSVLCVLQVSRRAGCEESCAVRSASRRIEPGGSRLRTLARPPLISARLGSALLCGCVGVHREEPNHPSHGAAHQEGSSGGSQGQRHE